MKWRCGLGLMMEHTLKFFHPMCFCAFLSCFNDMVLYMYVLTEPYLMSQL